MALRTLSDETAAPLVPPRPTLPKLRQAAADCRACNLWRRGTQTVFGEGSSRAILRAPDDATRRAETERFVEDLKKVARAIR